MIETAIQMRFADVDQLGHVNNVNLQHYFDLGKSDYYHLVLGLSFDWSGIGLVQKATETVYETQTRMMEPVVVRTRVEKIGTTSFTTYQEIVNKETGELKAYSRAVLVVFDFAHQEKVSVPPEWRRIIEECEGKEL